MVRSDPACPPRCATPNGWWTPSVGWAATWNGPGRAACSTATPTSGISTSTHRGNRASSTGNWLQAGPWYLDVGYHIASAVDVEDRRRSERDLLAHYLDRLAAEGGGSPSWDEAWRSIGVGMLYGFFLWAITLKVAPPITTVMLERLGAAVADHDAFSSVGPL